jgi:CO/xanthine dehydrogenase FAD-binding subunit
VWTLKEYRYAGSPAEAVALMRQGPGRGRYVAGGTDLLLEKPPDCDFVVDVNGAGCGGIETTPDGSLVLGATATLQALAVSPEVAAFAGGAVRAAALACGNRPVRSVGTLGGNLCHALPSADMAPILLALDGVARIADTGGTDEIPLRDFFTGPRRTVLGDRLLAAVVLPAPVSARCARARKLTRTAEDISLVQVAVGLDLDGGVARAARVALGAVAPTPLRADDAEARLAGVHLASPAGAAAIAEAAAAAAAAARPIDDQRASAEYRRAMVEVLTRRLLGEIVADAAEVTP